MRLYFRKITNFMINLKFCILTWPTIFSYRLREPSRDSKILPTVSEDGIQHPPLQRASSCASLEWFQAPAPTDNNKSVTSPQRRDGPLVRQPKICKGRVGGNFRLNIVGQVSIQNANLSWNLLLLYTVTRPTIFSYRLREPLETAILPTECEKRIPAPPPPQRILVAQVWNDSRRMCRL